MDFMKNSQLNAKKHQFIHQNTALQTYYETLASYLKNNLRRKIWQKTLDSFLSNLLLFFFSEPLKKAQDDFMKNIFAVLFRHETRKAGEIYRRLPDGDHSDRKPENNKMELIDHCI